MKRPIALVLLLSLFLLFSCSGGKVSPSDTVLAFREGYLPSGRVYLSDAEEGGEYYAPAGLLSDMLLFSPSDTVRWALLLHSRLDYTAELGIFTPGDSEEGLRIYEACLSRIALLRQVGVFGEGFAFLHRGAVIYGFFENGDEARSYLMGILK